MTTEPLFVTIPPPEPIDPKGERISQLERGMCEVYRLINAHDIEGAKRVLLQSGALP